MPKSFSIKINGLEELRANIKKADRSIPNYVGMATRDSTTLIQNKAKEVRPDSFKNRTGTLRRSIQKLLFNNGFSGKVFTDEKYSIYVEEGTRPHVIEPRVKKVLAFKVGGRLVFAKRVYHPGTRAYKFFERAFNTSIDAVTALFKKAANKTMADLKG